MSSSSSLSSWESPSAVTNGISSSPFAVVHFSAPWHQPCAHIDTVLATCSTDYPTVAFAKVQAESVAESSLKYAIEAVPTVVYFKGGVEVARVNGYNIDETVQKLKELVVVDASVPAATPTATATATPTPAPAPASAPASDAAPPAEVVPELPLTEVFRLAHQSAVVLFTSDASEASNALAESLRGAGITFTTADLSGRTELVNCLSSFSNSTDLPQLFINGRRSANPTILNDVLAAVPENCGGQMNTADALKTQLTNLTTQFPFLLCMKGHALKAKCKFSREMIALLQQRGVGHFETFDILSNETVRNGLKTFSNWPTYPQFYCGGTLVGGVDVVKGMDDEEFALALRRGAAKGVSTTF